MSEAAAPARISAARRRIVVATPLEPAVEEDLEPVSWPRTIWRLSVAPGVHPWKRGWRLTRRGPLFAVAVAALLLLLLAAGCATVPLLRLSQRTAMPAQAQGVRCESVLVSHELELPPEGELGEVRLTLGNIPEVTGKLRILVRQPRFASALDVDADGTPAFDKIMEVPGAREITLVLSRPRKASDDWPRSSCKACRVDVELTGLFGAREGLAAFLARAMEEASSIESAFSQQAAGRPQRSIAAVHDLGAQLTAEGRRCGVPLDPLVNAVTGALAQLELARATYYDGEAPRIPDAAAALRAWESASTRLQELRAGAAAIRFAGWPLSLRPDSAGPLRNSALHLDLAAQAASLSPDDQDTAARWIALAAAPDAGAVQKWSAALPRIRSLQDSQARLAWVDPQPGVALPLPGSSLAATLTVASFRAAPHGRRCIGALGAVPVRDRPTEAAAVALLLGADSRLQLRLSKSTDVAGVRETLRHARELLCEPLSVDVEGLFAGLEEKELGPVAERLETIYAESDPRRENDELARAVSARTARLLCRLLSVETVERRVSSVVGYKIFVEGGTRVLEFLPGPLVCEGRGVSGREVRRRLRDAWRSALDRHSTTDRLCPMRGGKCPDEIAASVRRIFSLQKPDLAAVAPAESRALDYPPPFGFGEAWVQKLDRCAREACESLAMLKADAPEGQFEGPLCAPPVAGAEPLQDVMLEKPDSPSSVTLSSCDAHAGVRLTLRRKVDAGMLVSIASPQQFRYGSENVTRQGRHPQLGRIYERVADLGDPADVSRRADGGFEVALTPTVENQVFYFFSLRRRDY